MKVSVSGRRILCAWLVLVILSVAVVTAVGAAPDWSSVPAETITTTEGADTHSFSIQAATDGTQLFFRARFNYTGASDPGKVFFAIEFAKSMNVTAPMTQGDEMIIVSQKGPDGNNPKTYDYYVPDAETQPVPIVPGPVTVEQLNIAGADYEMVFSRPMTTENPAEQYQYVVGQPVLLAFAISEWGLESAHSYTLFSYQMNITQSEVLLGPYKPPTQVTPPKPAGSAILTLAATYGQYPLYLVLILAGVHFVRRRAWKNHEKAEIPVERHVLAQRLAHWIRVSALAGFIVTGYSIFAGKPVFGTTTILVHVSLGFVILLVELPLHVYALIKKGEYKYAFIPRKDDIKVATTIALNFFGLTKNYPAHAVYDRASNDYYLGRKYCSYQKGLLWAYIFTLGGLGITGFAMYYPQAFQWLITLLGGRSAVLGIHLALFFVFTATFLGHIYLSVIPSNWERLRAIFTGSCKVPAYEAPIAEKIQSHETAKERRKV